MSNDIKTYDDAIRRLRNLNNMKHKLRQALGNIGIYLPVNVSMEKVLFCVYFYYMFNLFSDLNSNWKEKYFPLDGVDLYNFVEERMASDVAAGNTKYKVIANEILAAVYPAKPGTSDDVILDRGLLKSFVNFEGYNTDLKDKIGNISNNTINTDNVLNNTSRLLNKILSIWKWKKLVIEGTRRKRKEDKQTPVIEENAFLDDILEELGKEPRYRLPDLKIDRLKLTNENLLINQDIDFKYNVKYPYTIYSAHDTSRSVTLNSQSKKLFSPSNWNYNSELEIDNLRPNTKVGLYYHQRYNGQTDPNSDFPSYMKSGSFDNGNWDLKTKKKISISSISLTDTINISYKDKYEGIYDRNNSSIVSYRYLGWKPEIFLYSKAIVKNIRQVLDESYESTTDSPMDHMNLLDNEDFGNLGLTILVPSLVEKFMKEKAPNLDNLNTGTTDPANHFNFYTELRKVNKIRNIETVFLVGIYPVDNNNNIVYKDPIVFQFFSGEQLNDDLGLTFADYRKIKSPTTKDKVLLRKYYNIKLGQMFYRNNYSRVSTEKRITNVLTRFNGNSSKEEPTRITYEDNKVGDVSKNLLYLYGRDNYMPYVGKTSLGPTQNHNITNPDDNTYIGNITLPDNVEYVFKKYGNTKIAIQLYMATSNDASMSGLEYFKNIKIANGKFIDDNSGIQSSETLVNIPGSYMGLPYFTENTWSMGSTTTKNKAFPYRDSDIIDAKVPLPDWNLNNENRMAFGNQDTGLPYITEPVIIDCNRSDEHNAPWLDKRNAPYVSKVVTEDFTYYSNKKDPRNGTENVTYERMRKGIYIKIPNELSLYMMNDESVKKYVKRKGKYTNEENNNSVFEDKEFYGRITRDKYIRVIKNALLGIMVNYNPTRNIIGPSDGMITPGNFKTVKNNNRLFRSNDHFGIIEYEDELYIRIYGDYFEDLQFAGLGKFGTIKVQLIFRNEFFRSEDINSPLNYKYVPPTGDVTLLREIAGQRIKLYRGGILAHPTDYASKRDRLVYKNTFFGAEGVTDVSSTKEIAYKHGYTKGFPTIAMDGNYLSDVNDSVDVNPITLSDDNSVYDIISIEMDYPHWQELQINNIERSPISSMETDTNDISLPIPVNIIDLENFDFLEYNIEENSYANRFSTSSDTLISPKLSLRQPDEDKEKQKDVPKYIDFYRMLNFWYTFRPKVKFQQTSVKDSPNTNISIEPYNEWRTRILTENRDYFNKKNMKFSEKKGDDSDTETPDRLIDLEDFFNIRCYKYSYERYGSSDISTITRKYNKDSNSENLYNIMKFIILNHTIYIDSTSNTSIKTNFNNNNLKQAKFGGYILDKLLYSDWVFTYRKGDSKKIDDIMRQSANDTALYLFNMWYNTTNSIREQYNNNSFGGNQYINVYDYVKNSFNKLIKEFMMNTSNAGIASGAYNIYNDETGDVMLPGIKRLIDFKANNNCTLKPVYEGGHPQPENRIIYNVWNNRIYKGDNRLLDVYNRKAKLRRGFRMGDKTPDNPFMGFSMPATTNPDLVPDYIHLVYCDIYWKDFDKTSHEILDTGMDMNFSTSPDRNTIRGTDSMTYDFTGIIEKYNLNIWRAKGKHVIFRILVDEPTKERHKDCPDYINGEYYDNKYGKGFSPDFFNSKVKFHYEFAILALRRWINDHYDELNGLLYTIELPLGISGNGNMIKVGNEYPIVEIHDIYQSILEKFYEISGLIGERMPGCKLIFSSSVVLAVGESNKSYGWSFNNLGNRERFEEWMKYNMYGSDSTMANTQTGGIIHGGSKYSNFDNSLNNKFKASNYRHTGYNGVIRSDLSMEELMKPENFRELLYEMKSITPMYVIGYIDKERYPEQYESLMNEMGYKYTITSAVIEDGYLKVYYSNEGKNGIRDVSNRSSINIILKFKNKLKNANVSNTISSINRSQQYSSLNIITATFGDLAYTKINMGDVKMFKAFNPTPEVTTRPYAPGKSFKISQSVEDAYGKNMVDDVYLKLILITPYIYGEDVFIKLANVNRTTEINLTDSGLLDIFISNYTISGKELDPWFDTMYMNHIKVDDNGWI